MSNSGDGNTDNPRTITVTQDVTFTAEFETIYYTITALSNDEAMGSVEGSDSNYTFNSYAMLTAFPAQGFLFVQWNDGNIDNPRAVTVTEDATFIAEFAMDIENTYYQISVTANDNSLGTVMGDGSYLHGTTATLIAIPGFGAYFVQWSDGNSDNPRMITALQDSSFVAEFAETDIDYFTLTVLSNDEEMGTVSGGKRYAANSTATLTATPTQGHRFVQWQDGNTANPRTVTVTQDTTFTATFALINSITETTTYPYEVYARNSTLIIKQAEGQPVAIFDMLGRCLFQTTASTETTCTLPTAGVYVVRVGERFVRKVVVNE